MAACESHRFKTDAKRVRYLMGQLMKELIGRVDGRRLRELIFDKFATGQPAVAGRDAAGARRVAP